MIEIGKHIFKTKKDALNHYKVILNSYEFGQILNENDFNELIELLKMHPLSKIKFGNGIKTIKIVKIPKFNTKAFELQRIDNSPDIFSYINCLGDGFKKNRNTFARACRQAVQEDLRNVKLAYFQKHSKKGKVKCQETNELAIWEELVIDHRQPNTFSVIVDRFIELYKIDIQNIKYTEKIECINKFEDENIKKKFREYHKEKATLRIVKKNLNSSRAYQAKISKQSKDLKIE
jgi:hypothetical protein